MANAKKCDRCGSFYVMNSRYQRTVRNSKTVIDGVCKTTRSDDNVDFMDLCDDCLSALDNFLNMVEVEE